MLYFSHQGNENCLCHNNCLQNTFKEIPDEQGSSIWVSMFNFQAFPGPVRLLGGHGPSAPLLSQNHHPHMHMPKVRFWGLAGKTLIHFWMDDSILHVLYIAHYKLQA